MIQALKTKFDDPSSNFINIPGNKFYATPDLLVPMGEKSFDVEEAIKKHTEKDTDKFVFACRANNEALPFKDESFDAYIANLSLMLVDNYHNQLKEAFRVCKKGSKLGFTVWGRPEQSKHIYIFGEVLQKYGLAPK